MQCDSDEEELEKPNVEKKPEVQTPSKSEPIKQCVFCQVHVVFFNENIINHIFCIAGLVF